VGCAAGDDEHVALLEGQGGCALRGWGEPFAGFGVVCALGCAADFVEGGAFDDLEDVVAAFVPLELLGGFLFFGGEDDGYGEGGGGEEIVVAGVGLELLRGVGQGGGGEELEVLGGGSLGEERGLCEGEAGGGGERSGT